jgi:hypothetical protein
LSNSKETSGTFPGSGLPVNVLKIAHIIAMGPQNYFYLLFVLGKAIAVAFPGSISALRVAYKIIKTPHTTGEGSAHHSS